MSLNHWGLQGLALSLLIVVAGCGGSNSLPQGSLTGQVTLNGAPVTEGEVFLVSKTTGRGGSGTLDSEGKFQIPEIDAGEYVATINPSVKEYPPGGDGPDAAPPPATPIPKKYWSDTSSDLVVQVKEGGNEVTWELTE